MIQDQVANKVFLTPNLLQDVLGSLQAALESFVKLDTALEDARHKKIAQSLTADNLHSSVSPTMPTINKSSMLG